MTVREFLEDVTDGTFDNCLDKIEEAVKARQQILRVRNRPDPTPRPNPDRPFRVGDVVKLSHRGSVAYLRGKHVIITDRLQKNYRVRFLDGPQGRFGEGCKCPPSLLEWI